VIPFDLALPNEYECEYVIETKSEHENESQTNTGVHQ